MAAGSVPTVTAAVLVTCVTVLVLALSAQSPTAFRSSSSPESFNLGTLAGQDPTTLTLSSPHPHMVGDFGKSVAATSNWVVVGAPGENASGDSQAGNAYVFNAATGAQVQRLIDPNAQSSGDFGYAVSIFGTTAVVGAPYEEAAGESEAGHAYVFDAVTGALLQTLTSPNVQSFGDFGESVATTGSTVLVGAPGETSSTFVEGGNAYLFKASTGAPIASLSSPDVQQDGDFGMSVAINNTEVVVGAPGEGSFSGNAYVFTTAGASVYSLTSQASQKEGEFGASVAISGSRIVVGAPGETVTESSSAGHAYVFSESTGRWIFTLSSGAVQEFGDFGSAVALNTSTIVVGAYGEFAEGFDNAGHVYTFKATNGVRIIELKNPKPEEFGTFGWSVAASPIAAVVGAPGHTAAGLANAGHAYIFESS
jgi:hypothetical protein